VQLGSLRLAENPPDVKGYSSVTGIATAPTFLQVTDYGAALISVIARVTSEDTSKPINAKQRNAGPACCIERADDARIGRESACGRAEQRIARLHREAAGENEGGEIQRVGPASREFELPGKRREQRDRERIGERQQEGPAKADAPYMGTLGRRALRAQRALREPQSDPDQGCGRCERQRLPIVLEQPGKLGAGGESQHRVHDPLAGLERFDSQCLDGLEVFGIGGNDSEFVFDGGGGDKGIGEL